MATDQERLVIALEARVREFERNFARANRTANREFSAMERRAGQSARRLETQMAGASAGIGRGFKLAAASIAGSFAAIGLQKFMREARTAIGTLADMKDSADRVGLDTEAFQGLQRGFQLAGVDASGFASSMEMLTQRIGEAALGEGSLLPVLQRANIAIRDQKGAVRPTLDILRDYADMVANIPDEAQRLALLNDAFGRSGRTLALAFSDGSRGIDRMIQSARDGGYILDQGIIDRAAELDDRFDDLTRKTGNWFKAFAVGSADFVDQVADMRAALDQLFPNPDQARAVLGNELYEGLASDRDAVNEAAGDIGQLRGEYLGLGDDARQTASALDAASATLRAWGYDEVADDLAEAAREMRGLSDQFQAGTLSGDEFATKLGDVQVAATDAFTAISDMDRLEFGNTIANLGALGTAIAGIVGLAQSARSAIAAIAGVNLPGTDAATEDPRGNTGNARNAFVRPTDQAPSSVTRPQARDVSNIDFGYNPPEAASSGGGSGGSGGSGGAVREDRYTQATDRIREQIAALEAEATARQSVTGSVREQEAAVDRARMVHELLNTAQEAGIAITPELTAEAQQLAQAYQTAEQATRDLAEAAQTAANAQDQVKGIFQDAFTGAITGANSLLDVLGQIISRLAEMAAARLFETVLWPSIGGAATSLLGFADGGYTGPGRKHQPRGIVHAGEYVVPADAVKKLGLPALDALASGKVPGFASGGFARGSLSSTYAPSIAINVNGENQGPDLARQIAREVKKQLPDPDRFRQTKSSAMLHQVAALRRGSNGAF